MKKLGKFEIIQKVGQGAMGVVYKAHDPMIDLAETVPACRKAVTDALVKSGNLIAWRNHFMSYGTGTNFVNSANRGRYWYNQPIGRWDHNFGEKDKFYALFSEFQTHGGRGVPPRSSSGPSCCTVTRRMRSC